MERSKLLLLYLGRRRGQIYNYYVRRRSSGLPILQHGGICCCAESGGFLWVDVLTERNIKLLQGLLDCKKKITSIKLPSRDPNRTRRLPSGMRVAPPKSSIEVRSLGRRPAWRRASSMGFVESSTRSAQSCPSCARDIVVCKSCPSYSPSMSISTDVELLKASFASCASRLARPKTHWSVYSMCVLP